MVSFSRVFQDEISSLQAIGEVRKEAYQRLDWALGTV